VIRYIERNRISRHSLKVAAPPIAVAVVALHSLNDDQQIGIDGLDGISGTGGGGSPILGGVACGASVCAVRGIAGPASAGWAALRIQVWFIAQIHSNDNRISIRGAQTRIT